MKALVRLWLQIFTWFYEVLYLVLFPVFFLLGLRKRKKLSDRVWDAHDAAAAVDPFPDEDELARRERRKARRPGQLADFDQ